jgi:hypothetical protein
MDKRLNVQMDPNFGIATESSIAKMALRLKGQMESDRPNGGLTAIEFIILERIFKCSKFQQNSFIIAILAFIWRQSLSLESGRICTIAIDAKESSFLDTETRKANMLPLQFLYGEEYAKALQEDSMETLSF